jgi:hypothetical protein
MDAAIELAVDVKMESDELTVSPLRAPVRPDAEKGRLAQAAADQALIAPRRRVR